MNPEISAEEIEIANAYLQRVRRGELAQDFRLGGFSESDLQNVYPALLKLLEFADKNLTSSDKADYNYMLHASTGNPKHTFESSLQHPKIFEGIIESYKEIQLANSRHSLFSMKLSEMDGYQLQSYLQQIGLVR